MSAEPSESKTIRIDALSYYKLNELSGLATAVYGIKFPTSLMAKFAIEEFYFKYIGKARDLINNPVKAERARNAYLKDQKKRSEVFGNALE